MIIRKMATKKKREALTVSRLINEVLVQQLAIPFRQIVNDTSFSKYTGIQRPDLLISEIEFDGENEEQYVKNLVAYAEVKDNCVVGDIDWKDAIKQGKKKSQLLNLPYFIVTNCIKTIFYNSLTGKELVLNKNPIREFQTIDIYRLLINKLKKDPGLSQIDASVDSLSAVSEAIFNKKLWELANIYRNINFKNNVEKIDFTIGFIALEYFEEKEIEDNIFDKTKISWSGCIDDLSEKLVGNLSTYIQRLERETNFKEFKNLMETVRISIAGEGSKKPLIDKEDVRDIYNVIDSMKPLHGCGFDLFGAVYEMFASTKEKKDFGEYFTRRHYTHVFSKLLLEQEKFFNDEKKFTIIDPACGTGGFLTEGFKVLKKNFEDTDTLNKKSKNFLEEECFYGYDIREENVSRTRLNMFLVGDGHTNIIQKNSLRFEPSQQFDYIITNPPYGNGTTKSETSSIYSTRLEIAFICRIIKLLKVGGKACIIIPDGVLENPSLKNFRKEILEKCNIDAIISLPKFAFAPYTKEKTYALFMTKRSEKITKMQANKIWMYIIDNDGLANSDKRFPTKLRNNKNGWKHDEISGWVDTNGNEQVGLLEKRWMKYEDLGVGTEWINEKGVQMNLKKAEFVLIEKLERSKYYILLPEFYLRPFEPRYINEVELDKEIKGIKKLFGKLKL